MRIATYNVWNSEAGMPQREKYIIDEILKTKADVLCLQEVRDKAQAEYIANQVNYEYFFFDNYKNEDEGLCILSNIPFVRCASWLDTANAICCYFLWNKKEIVVVNLHLPWDSVLQREKQITDIVTRVDMEKVDYVFLSGDFNCSDTSDVHRFLIGDCSLANMEANPCWYDLALSYATETGSNTEYTLNFRENPRFSNNTIETNLRADRILLRNTYPCAFPVLKACSLFGKRVYDDIHLSASDHYGVVVEMDFS